VEFLHNNALAAYPSVYADESGTYWYAQPGGTLRDNAGNPPFFPTQDVVLLDNANAVDYTTLGISATGGDFDMTATGGTNGIVTIARGSEGMEISRTGSGWNNLVSIGNVGAARAEGKTFAMIVRYDGSPRSMNGLLAPNHVTVTGNSYHEMEIAAWQAGSLGFSTTYGGGREGSWSQAIGTVESTSDYMKLEFANTATNGSTCRAVSVSGSGADLFAASEETGTETTWQTTTPAAGSNVAFGIAPFVGSGANKVVIKALKVS
jgi:hypothetical protein